MLDTAGPSKRCKIRVVLVQHLNLFERVWVVFDVKVFLSLWDSRQHIVDDPFQILTQICQLCLWQKWLYVDVALFVKMGVQCGSI